MRHWITGLQLTLGFVAATVVALWALEGAGVDWTVAFDTGARPVTETVCQYRLERKPTRMTQYGEVSGGYEYNWDC